MVTCFPLTNLLKGLKVVCIMKLATPNHVPDYVIFQVGKMTKSMNSNIFVQMETKGGELVLLSHIFTINAHRINDPTIVQILHSPASMHSLIPVSSPQKWFKRNFQISPWRNTEASFWNRNVSDDTSDTKSHSCR